ncbi:ribosomal-protein-alanine acetyltransferase [Moniliophthora roreri MCA 2997]|uniref:Ribosomal-protein-alanine acetyltransferase n=1 Tax=Moniliophthora roreri (strain MCA 2997) TaxID=1381753 RepID=V2XVY0_MONRO|nr:ribosomal-protein-alanine acetyltransferase [Moniliophthora roreri MCA 2997]
MAPHNIVLKSRTSRLRLEPAAEVNDEANAKIRMHPETRRYLRYLPEHFTTEEAQRLRESRVADPAVLEFNIYVKDKDGNDRFAGGTLIFHIEEQHRSCEVGIILSPEVHRGGVATDVFYTLLSYIFEERKMHRVTFETGSDNLAMRGWLEKVAGARIEAQRLECWIDPVSGGYSDVTGYAILEWEWKDRIKERLENRLGI